MKKYNKIFFLVFISLLIWISSFGNNKDSLLNIIENATDEYLLGEYYYELARTYLDSNLDSTYILLLKSERYCKESNNYNYLCNTFSLKGFLLIRFDSINESIVAYNEYFKVFHLSDRDFISKIRALSGISIAYEDNSDYISAIKRNIEALELCDSINNEYEKGPVLNNLGSSYLMSGK